MENLITIFPIETIICLSLTPLVTFFLIKSATENKRQEFIYTNLAVAVLLIMLIIVIKYLKDVI